MGFVVGQVLLAPPIGRGLFEEVGQYRNLLTAVWVWLFLDSSEGLVALVTTKGIVRENGEESAGHVAGVTTVCIKRKSEVSGERVSLFVLNLWFWKRGGKNGTEWSHNKQEWVSDHRPVNLDIPVKFISYTSMGVVAIAINYVPGCLHTSIFSTQQ